MLPILDPVVTDYDSFRGEINPLDEIVIEGI